MESINKPAPTTKIPLTLMQDIPMNQHQTPLLNLPHHEFLIIFNLRQSLFSNSIALIFRQVFKRSTTLRKTNKPLFDGDTFVRAGSEG
jgi:hypothetical protein